MAKKKKMTKEPKPATAVNRLKYKQMTVEIAFTDGGTNTATFYDPADCFRYIERTVTEHYADSVRVELF